VTNANGCQSAASAATAVTVNALPVTPSITTDGPATFCIGGSVTLISSAGSSYLWSTGATSASIIVITSGNYTVRVTNADGCQSAASAVTVVTVNALPAKPTVGTITPPTCLDPTGSAEFLNLPSPGIWTLTCYPGTVTTQGTETSATISGLSSGTYNYTVTNSAGCISLFSANVVIPAQPITPTAPVVGTITQPTYSVPSGSVVLSGLPASESWTITRSPGDVTSSGIGTSKTISDLPGGVYTFKVTNSTGCTSAASAQVIISTPGVPVLIITNPAPVCSTNTVDLTVSDIITGSTPGLTYTYWTDAAATIAYGTPAAATAGTYYIKGTTISGYFNIQPVIVTVYQIPVPHAGPDQILEYVFRTKLDAEPVVEGSGKWSLISGTGEFRDANYDTTTVTKLKLGRNDFRWTVTNGVCPAVSDDVTITVNDLLIPTLITPNGDLYNEKFIIRGLEETLGNTELIIFDRRGAQVYKNMNYDNSWNGLDYNGNELPDDTYFYVVKSKNGKSLSGYIVIRR
jgi:gliding motility-associated-like protein